jgi:hypothetical protein
VSAILTDGRRLVSLVECVRAVLTEQMPALDRPQIAALARAGAAALRAVEHGDTEAPIRLPKGAAVNVEGLGAMRRPTAAQVVEALGLARMVATLRVPAGAK